VPLVLAGVALVLALLLSLLARDVRRWQRSVEDGDLSFQVAPGPNRLWEPRKLALGGLSGRLLGVDDDLELRAAAQLFRRSRPREAEARQARELAIATSARVAFEQIQRGDHEPPVRSIAANQIGILTLADLLSNPTQAAQLAQRATRSFAAAIRLDPSNQVAQRNLELLLTLIRADDPRFEPEGVTSRRGGSSAGAGSSTSGTGF
jgi:hypothetical protein